MLGGYQNQPTEAKDFHQGRSDGLKVDVWGRLGMRTATPSRNGVQSARVWTRLPVAAELKVLVPRPQTMKVTGDYKAKTRIWAQHPKVITPPPGPRLPRFKAMKFRTHAEMNRWKAALLREIAGDAARHG